MRGLWPRQPGRYRSHTLKLQPVGGAHAGDLVEMVIEGQHNCADAMRAAADNDVRQRKNHASAIQIPERLFHLLPEAIVGRNIDHYIPTGAELLSHSGGSQRAADL